MVGTELKAWPRFKSRIREEVKVRSINHIELVDDHRLAPFASTLR